jgi:hypothetical protein
MEIREITLSVADDIDGSGMALRGWLASVGPGTGWTVQSAAPSDGQGVAQDIAVYLDSAVAALTLYDRIRQWITSRGKQAKPVTVTATVETGKIRSAVTVTIDPQAIEDSDGRAG